MLTFAKNTGWKHPFDNYSLQLYIESFMESSDHLYAFSRGFSAEDDFEKLLWVVCILCSKAIRKILSVSKEHCKDEEAIKELSYTTAIIRLVLRCWTTFVLGWTTFDFGWTTYIVLFTNKLSI